MARAPGEQDLSAPWLVVEEQPDGLMRAGIVYNAFGFDLAAAEELARRFRARVDDFGTSLSTPSAV